MSKLTHIWPDTHDLSWNLSCNRFAMLSMPTRTEDMYIQLVIIFWSRSHQSRVFLGLLPPWMSENGRHTIPPRNRSSLQRNRSSLRSPHNRSSLQRNRSSLHSPRNRSGLQHNRPSRLPGSQGLTPSSHPPTITSLRFSSLAHRHRPHRPLRCLEVDIHPMRPSP
jgi:hypothetical protein